MNAFSFNSGTIEGTVSRSKIVYLQYLRAIAAISVLLFHASVWLEMIRQNSVMLNVFSSWFGSFGVKLFFATSGYLMADLALSASAWRFLAHRIIRIYPIYWMSVAAAFLLTYAFTPFFKATAGPTIIGFDPYTLLLVPGTTIGFMLGVEWTLPFELSFYFFTFIFIVGRMRNLIPFFAVSWLSILLFLALMPQFIGKFSNLPVFSGFPSPFELPLNAHCIPFVGGLLIPSMLARGSILGFAHLIGAGAIAASLFFSFVPSFILTSIGCVLLVAYAASNPNIAVNPSLRILYKFGDWSFALYLVHVPIICIIYRLAPAFTPCILLWTSAVIASLLVSISWGQLDNRLYKFLKEWIDRSNNYVAYGISALFLTIIGAEICYTQWEQSLFQEFTQDRNQRDIELGNQIANTIVSGSRSASFDPAATLNELGWRRDDNLVGFVEKISTSPTLQIEGAALDRANYDRSVILLVFQGNRFLGTALPRLRRRDIERNLNISHVRPGYSAAFDTAKSCIPTAIIVNPSTHSYSISGVNAIVRRVSNC
jgi:exopolysaccharide production protein ExoZ